MLPTTSENCARAQYSGPHSAHLPPHDFLPAYEQHMNDHLRDFGEPESQTSCKKFELDDRTLNKRRRLDLRKYLGWLLLTCVLITIGIIFMASWWGGGFKKHRGQDQSTLSTRSEAILTAAPLTTMIVVAIIETTPIETITSTTVIYDSPSPSPTSASLATINPMSTVQPTSTATVDPAWSSSLSVEISRIESYLDHPLSFLTQKTTTLISVTTISPTTVTATPTSTPAAPVTMLRQTGLFYWCGVPGNACG